MKNSELLGAVLKSGGVKLVKGSNLVYTPIDILTSTDTINITERLRVSENWKLLGVIESFNTIILAYVVTNKLTGKYEVWALKRSHLSTRRYVRQATELVKHKRRHDTEFFEIINPRRNCLLTPMLGEPFISRAHPFSLKTAINSAKHITRLVKDGTPLYCVVMSSLRDKVKEGRRVALTDIGDSDTRIIDNDPELQSIRSKFLRVEKLLERIEGLSEEESKTFLAAYYVMEYG